jgi:ABC-type bacteriocin/lantibiotic exporter with double-glycine peptidase domain
MGLATLGSAGIFWFGARAVIVGEMSIGSSIMFRSYLASFYGPL